MFFDTEMMCMFSTNDCCHVSCFRTSDSVVCSMQFVFRLGAKKNTTGEKRYVLASSHPAIKVREKGGICAFFLLLFLQRHLSSV